MKNLALILLLAFAVSGCATSRAADPPQSKVKTVAVAKAKPKAVTAPVKSASQPATPAPAAKKNKTWRWYAPWRKKDG